MPEALPVPPVTGDPAADAAALLASLRARANAGNVAWMARFGITGAGILGISVTDLRAIARGVLGGRKAEGAWRHDLADLLWRSEVHEARILAALLDEPSLVTREQMERWVAGFDSWDLCDQVCANLFDRTAYAWTAVTEWAGREEEFVKRAAFALAAALAWHDKRAEDERFIPLLALIEQHADDERNFVKKAVNWALRTIGKRSPGLNAAAVAAAARIRDRDSSRAARWIASDALRELRSEAVRARLGLPPS